MLTHAPDAHPVLMPALQKQSKSKTTKQKLSQLTVSTAKPVLMSAPQAPSPWNKFFSSPFLMYTFLIGIAILVVGYFTWGK